MREIKFRAWLPNRKKMVSLAAIYLDENRYAFGYRQKGGFLDLVEEEEKPSIMQYTGLKDSNGKEIYEGDIVRYCLGSGKSDEWPPSIDYISYIAEKCGEPSFDFGKKRAETYPDDLLYYSNDLRYYLEEGFLEVIGNIYENPELMGNKNND